jgi:hypothetical protein
MAGVTMTALVRAAITENVAKLLLLLMTQNLPMLVMVMDHGVNVHLGEIIILFISSVIVRHTIVFTPNHFILVDSISVTLDTIVKRSSSPSVQTFALAMDCTALPMARAFVPWATMALIVRMS